MSRFIIIKPSENNIFTPAYAKVFFNQEIYKDFFYNHPLLYIHDFKEKVTTLSKLDLHQVESLLVRFKVNNMNANHVLNNFKVAEINHRNGLILFLKNRNMTIRRIDSKTDKHILTTIDRKNKLDSSTHRLT